jgi:hypothetical protein
MREKKWIGWSSLLALLFCGAVSTVPAQNLAELRWDYKLEHNTPAEAPAYDAWVISPPASGSAEAKDLAGVLESISHEKAPAISGIFLRELNRQPELQKAVMEYVTAQPEFQKHPPPTGFGHWEFKNSAKMRALVEQGLLRSPFVTDCNALLAKHGKAIKSVSMEKLFFTKKDGEWGWDAMVWLVIDPPPKAAAKVPGGK